MVIFVECLLLPSIAREPGVTGMTTSGTVTSVRNFCQVGRHPLLLLVCRTSLPVSASDPLRASCHSECGPVVTQPRGSLQPDPAFVPLPHTPCYTQTPLLLSPQTPCMLSVCPLPRCLANFIQSSNLSLGITNHHSSPTCPSPLTPIEAAPRFVSPPVPCPLPLWTGSCWKAGPGLPPSYP